VKDHKLPGATYHAAALQLSGQVDFSGALTYPFAYSKK
jgi:hypothetical protein